MSHARCTLAARTPLKTLKEAALKAWSAVEPTGETKAGLDSFDEVLDFCQPRTEEIGGPPGSDSWYFHQVGQWAVMGDLGLLLYRDPQALAALSRALGTEVVVCAIDTALGFAFFAMYQGGQVKRQLTLEDGEYEALGLPVQAERGRPLVDFTEDEAERIWTSYGLPTFEYNPEEGPFECVALRRKN